MSSRMWCSYSFVSILLILVFNYDICTVKNGLFLRGHVLEPNYDYFETKSSSSIRFKASSTKNPREKEFLRYTKGNSVNIYEVVP